jgi:LysM repeat protein
VLSETRLTFVVWSSAGRPPAQQPLDERTARGVLGLPTLVAAATVQPTPTPVPTPVSATPTAAPVLSAPTYTVQAGESMDSIAARLGVDPGALWWANRSDLDPLAPLVAGARLRLPPVQGFLYEIQPGDTWDSVATTFGASAAVLRLRNDMSADALLPTAGLVFIPRPT